MSESDPKRTKWSVWVTAPCDVSVKKLTQGMWT